MWFPINITKISRLKNLKENKNKKMKNSWYNSNSVVKKQRIKEWECTERSSKIDGSVAQKLS